MILLRDIDPEKAQRVLAYLAHSTRKALANGSNPHLQEDMKIRATEDTVQKVNAELDQIKGRLVQAIAREKALMQDHKSDQLINEEMQKRIEHLIGHLEHHAQRNPARVERIRELRKKVEEHHLPFSEKVDLLTTQLRSLERLYRQVPHVPRYKKRLEALKVRIAAVRKELKGMQAGN